MSQILKTIFKAIVHLWIVFHVTLILIMPNSGSFIGRYYEKWILPYTNTIGLNSAWSFFSPDPSLIFTMKYRLLFLNENGEELKPSIDGQYPRYSSGNFINPIRMRELYTFRFFNLIDSYRENFLFPWLCRQNTGASHVEIQAQVESYMSLDKAMKMDSSGEKTFLTEHLGQEQVRDCAQYQSQQAGINAVSE